MCLNKGLENFYTKQRLEGLNWIAEPRIRYRTEGKGLIMF
jgi:hypothetical protein